MNPEKINTLHAIRDRFKGVTGATQCIRLKAALSELPFVNSLEASRHLDIYDPRARIKDLRQRGEDIQRHWMKVVTEAGVVHRVGAYVLHHTTGTKA